MNDSISNGLAMLEQVDAQLNTPASLAVYQSNTTVVQLVADNRTDIDYIGEEDETVLVGSQGTTLEKTAQEGVLVGISIKVKKGLLAYANQHNDYSHKKIASLCDSAVKGLRDNPLKNYATKLFKIATALGNALVPYNVKASDILALDTAIQDYVPLIAKREPAKNVVKLANLHMANRLRSAKKRLRDILDPIIGTYEDTNPDFVLGYKSSRITHHLGHRSHDDKSYLELNIRDFETEQYLNNATVTIVNTEETTPSTPDAATLVHVKKHGSIVIRVSCPGHLDVEEEYEIDKGEIISDEILLEPIQQDTP